MPSQLPSPTGAMPAVAGAIGALLLFVGDLLIFGHIGPGSTFREGARQVAQLAPLERIALGGAIGPIGACLLLVGVWYIHSCLTAPTAKVGRAAIFFLAVFAVSSAAVHAVWAAHAIAIKFCLNQGPACEFLLKSLQSYWGLTFLVAAVPAAVGFLLLGWLVARSQTRFPRWTLVANPVLLLALSPAAAAIPAPLGAAVVGGAASLALLLFFLVSMVAVRHATPAA